MKVLLDEMVDVLHDEPGIVAVVAAGALMSRVLKALPREQRVAMGTIALGLIEELIDAE